MVILTANGLSVKPFVFLISSRSSLAVGKVSEEIMPRPPALETAATSSARDSQSIAPWIIGYSMPNISLTLVLNTAALFYGHRLNLHLPPQPHFVILDDDYPAYPVNTPGKLNPQGDVTGLDNNVADGGGGGISQGS